MVLVGLAEALTSEPRRSAVRRYLDQLNLGIECSDLDAQDQETASQEDRQGLGLSRQRTPPRSAVVDSSWPLRVPMAADGSC